MDKFTTSYKTLNQQQKRAVDTIDGPLLVVAGPGTGKTQLLALRAAKILQKADVDPDNILCLTFTNKAAINMQERLINLIGAAGRKIAVKTFHSFAAEIMNRYPDHFWQGAKLTTIPDPKQLEVIETILSELPLNHPLALKYAGQYTLISEVIDHIKLTKEAGLTPNKLKSIINLNVSYLDLIEPLLAAVLAPRISKNQIAVIAETIENLPVMSVGKLLQPLRPLDRIIKDSFLIAQQLSEFSGKNTPYSKWKSKWLQNVDGQKKMVTEQKRNKWWLGLAEVYEKYQLEIERLGYYDYADMIIQVITAIEQNKELRAEIQERYTFVMIDEFQDTNLAQSRLAHLVADYDTPDHQPNLMAVGDDDQTIFRFQGAELNNMANFIDDYKAEVIVLESNYRSTQEILDISDSIIQQSSSRLTTLKPEITKKLKAVHQASDKTNLLEHRTFVTSEYQYNHVANLISQLNQKGSVAVLARGHSSLINLVPYLKKYDLPINYEKQNNILEDDIVKNIIAIANTVQSLLEGDINGANAYIASFIRHPLWQIDGYTLWQIAISNRGVNNWLESLLDHENPKISSIGHWLIWLSGVAEQESLANVMEYIFGLEKSQHLTSPILEYLKQQDNKIKSLSAINLLRNTIYELGGNTVKLSDFVNTVNRMIKNQKGITDETSYVSGENAVNLMTVHKSKGLEFDSVIIIDAMEKEWSPKDRRRYPPANLPLQSNGDEDDDFIRLLYVATTRAKKNLVITSYNNNAKGEISLPSTLITSDIYTKQIKPTDNDPEAAEVLETALRWPRLEYKDEKQLIASILEQYQLSATHFINFLNVADAGPQHFLETNLLRLPEKRSEKSSFGSAMHAALEASQIATNNDSFDINIALNVYEKALQKESLSANSYERYLIHGQDVLKRLFDEYGFKLSTGAKPEIDLKDIRVGEAILNGKLDSLLTDKNSIAIADYKTGSALSSLFTKSKNQQIKSWRQKLQIEFYILLLNNSPEYGKYKINSAEIIYLEAKRKENFKLQYLPQKETLLNTEKLIKAVWQRIINFDFPDTSQYSQDIDGINKFCEDLIK